MESAYPQILRLEDTTVFLRGFANDIIPPATPDHVQDDMEQAQRVVSMDAIQSAFVEVQDEANVAARKLTRMTG